MPCSCHHFSTSPGRCGRSAALGCLARDHESVFLTWTFCPTLWRGAGPLCPATWSGGRLQVGFSLPFVWLLFVLSTFPNPNCSVKQALHGCWPGPCLLPGFLLQVPQKSLESLPLAASEAPEPAQRQN